MTTAPMLKRLAGVMRYPTLYALWQAPFREAKLAPLVRHNDLRAVRRVLDVGCGPGTNAARFAHARYVGIDLNADYIRKAEARFRGTFLVADARAFDGFGELFDCILVNSLLHHIDTPDVHAMLRQLSRQLTNDGHLHVIDLVLPEGPGIARYLARADRGNHARPLEAWHELLTQHLEEDVFEPFSLRVLGRTMWHLVYFKGHTRLKST